MPACAYGAIRASSFGEDLELLDALLPQMSASIAPSSTARRVSIR